MKAAWIRAVAVLSLSAAVAATGCKKTTPAGSQPAVAGSVLNSDGSRTNPDGTVTMPAGSAPAQAQGAPQAMAVRNPDGSITNPDGSVTYPAGSAVANRELAPNGPPPASNANTVPSSTSNQTSPAPSGTPVPVAVTVPVGTPVTVRINSGLAASRNDVGDRFTGVLDRPLVSHGETVFAAGTPVSGEVVASKGKGRFKGAGDLGIELTAIGRDRVETSEYEKIAKGRGKRTAGFIGGGGGLGALIGGIAGGGKGALIGGLAGAGAGTAAGAYSGGRDVVIPSESVITFRLRTSLSR